MRSRLVATGTLRLTSPFHTRGNDVETGLDAPLLKDGAGRHLIAGRSLAGALRGDPTCEALREIKADPALRGIPVVILTTSKAEEDVVRSYRDGVNSFITKPVTFTALIEVVQTLGKYWLQVVDLPGAQEGKTR